ncbi:MAG TPA: hypothetical protein VJM32_04640 [Candidatus Saccharimonadales bacterium]|nr:hypothetical protein [Candidatus Saccharimonadales bacterium]
MSELVPAHVDQKQGLRERIFGTKSKERSERRQAGGRKIGGFGIRLMMDRLFVGDRGSHAMSRVDARPAPRHRAAETGPTAVGRAPVERRALAPAPPEVSQFALPVSEGGRHRPENIAPEDRRSVSELVGVPTGADDSDPNVIGTRSWRNKVHTPTHAAGDPADRMGVIEPAPSYLADTGDHQPTHASTETYVPEPSNIRPEIPGVEHGVDAPAEPVFEPLRYEADTVEEGEPLQQRVPGAEYDPQDDLAFEGSRARHELVKEEHAAYTPPDPNGNEARASYFGGSNVDRK